MLSQLEIENMKEVIELTMVDFCDIIRQTAELVASGTKTSERVVSTNVKCKTKLLRRRTSSGEIITSPIQHQLTVRGDQDIQVEDIIKKDSKKFRVVEVHEQSYKVSKLAICEEI